jgi:hypothetical protein
MRTISSAFNFIGVQCPRAAGTRRFLLDSSDARLQKPLPPPRHRVATDFQPGSDFQILFPFRREQNDPSSLHQTTLNFTAPSVSLQLRFLFSTQRKSLSNPQSFVSYHDKRRTGQYGSLFITHYTSNKQLHDLLQRGAFATFPTAASLAR